MKTIERLAAILSSDELLIAIVVDELTEIRSKYGDDRRTDIIEESGEFRVEDLIADEDVVITATSTGYIKRTALDAYRQQRRAARASSACRRARKTSCSTCSSPTRTRTSSSSPTAGRCYWLRVYEVPESRRSSKGQGDPPTSGATWPREKIARGSGFKAFPGEERAGRFMRDGKRRKGTDQERPSQGLRESEIPARHNRDPDRRRRSG
jgi:DNA gyrase subunit A